MLKIIQVNSIEPNPIACIAKGPHKSPYKALPKLTMLTFKVTCALALATSFGNELLN